MFVEVFLSCGACVSLFRRKQGGSTILAFACISCQKKIIYFLFFVEGLRLTSGTKQMSNLLDDQPSGSSRAAIFKCFNLTAQWQGTEIVKAHDPFLKDSIKKQNKMSIKMVVKVQ